MGGEREGQLSCIGGKAEAARGEGEKTHTSQDVAKVDLLVLAHQDVEGEVGRAHEAAEGGWQGGLE